MWLAMPRVIAISVGSFCCIALLCLWFCFLRPASDSDAIYQEVDVGTSSTSISSPQEVKQSAMTLMVLEWSSELRSLLQRYVESQGMPQQSQVTIVNRDGVVTRVERGAILERIDSVWKADHLDYSRPVTLSSLSTVLRVGFQESRRTTRHAHQIVLLGRFPDVPSQKELLSRGSKDPILATDDYLWLKGTVDQRVVFLVKQNTDPLREQLQRAFAEHHINYDVTTEHDLNAQ